MYRLRNFQICAAIYATLPRDTFEGSMDVFVFLWFSNWDRSTLLRKGPTPHIVNFFWSRWSRFHCSRTCIPAAAYPHPTRKCKQETHTDARPSHLSSHCNLLPPMPSPMWTHSRSSGTVP